LLLPRATFAFAGRTLRFRSDDADVRFAVRAPHHRFLASDGADEVDCDLVVSFGDPAPSSRPVRFFGAGNWELRDAERGGDEVCFYGRVHAGDPEPMTRVRLDPSLRSGEVVQLPFYDGGRTFLIGFPVDEHVANRVLARSGAVVLHAASVLDGDDAIVFAGHSGAGKSTISRIAEDAGARVLSDDRTILTVGDDGVVRAHGTPWHGSLRRGAAGSAPVRAIYLLSQAHEDRAELLAEPAALSELYVRVIQPSVDATEVGNVLDALVRVVARSRVARLYFRPQPSAFAVARRDLGVHRHAE
jgi:hypothetical protein